jgi:hypothetical protein
MAVERVDRSREAISRGREAGRLAMDASANLLQTQVVKAFGSDYYKGGAFRSTLQVKQSIRRQGPNWAGTGWESTVGTKLIEALYWELGHQNTFTRKRERVQIWEPTARESVPAIRATYARVMVRYMGAR